MKKDDYRRDLRAGRISIAKSLPKARSPKAVPNIDRPAKDVRSGSAFADSSQRRRTARAMKSKKILLP
jgi:hypothetical protein